jgi:hypothetical protein
MPAPPVVEVDAGVVSVSVSAEVPAPVSVPPPRPVWPPPVGVVVPAPAPESAPEPAPVSALPEPVDVDVVELLVAVVVATGGVATPVVGTVSNGAPLVSFEEPLPPHAAIASVAATAAESATKER